ncbi:mechanosensitive ion channel [Candidatus Woesearchaeota archaeon]|nr:mechanosensitive ion channel [Candidatus Woesearchaeota archaeon]
MPEEDYIGSTLKNLKEEILSLRFKIIFLFILLILKIYFASNIKENIAIYRIYYIFLYYIILRLIAEFVEIFILRIYNKKHGYELNHYDNFVLAVHRISLFLSHLIFFFILLDLFGLEFSKIITSISIFTATLTFMFSEYIINLISGISIMFSKKFKINQYIQVGEIKGRVINLTLLHIELMNDSGELIFVPNRFIFIKEITNISKTNRKKIKFEFLLPISLYNQIDNLEKEVKEQMLDKFKENLAENNISLDITKVNTDSALIVFNFEIDNFSYNKEQKIKKEAGKIILKFISKQKQMTNQANIKK